MAVETQDLDAAVVGLGPAGLVAALALAAAGLRVGLIGPPPDAPSLARDTRTTALFGGSIALLRHLGVWAALEPDAAPLNGLRLVDATGGLLRAPETLFQAAETGRVAFGWNVENARLISALHDRARAVGDIRHEARPLARLVAEGLRATLTLDDGARLTARLVVGADGRQSLCREAANVETRRWSYPQGAIATRFRHSRPHAGVSSELHYRHGPVTTVPLPGNASSLVWVDRSETIDTLQRLTDTDFTAALEEKLQGLLGGITGLGARAAFPLTGLTAKPAAHQRIVLIGEAAHVLPPIGAQGLNLGFRDAAWIAELAGAAQAAGRDIGDDAVLQDYRAARSTDVATRTLAVEWLNRSLTADLLPADLMRGAGIATLTAWPWLRRRVMQEGMVPSGPQPRLLREA